MTLKNFLNFNLPKAVCVILNATHIDIRYIFVLIYIALSIIPIGFGRLKFFDDFENFFKF